MAAETLESVAASRPASFSWDALLRGNAQPTGLRGLIAVIPHLATGELEPGRRATDAIRRSAADLQLASNFQANVRLTGPVPISDDEFASVKKGFAFNSTVTGLSVLAILWLALRSWRLVLAVAITLTVGLVITAGLTSIEGKAGRFRISTAGTPPRLGYAGWTRACRHPSERQPLRRRRRFVTLRERYWLRNRQRPDEPSKSWSGQRP